MARKVVLSVFVLAALALVACGGGGEEPAAPAAPAPAGGGAQAAPAGDVREITVEATSFKFTPSSFSVKAGERVRVTVINRDIFHTFTIRDLGVDLSLQGGQTGTVEFVADKAGTYEIICKPHVRLGMVGTLEVN